MGQLTARQTARRAALEARVRDHHPLGAGLTVDTTHVVLSGAESRQSLYVALTRGRSENHIYLADAAVEPDSLPGVDSLNPTTAEDILASILRRDGAQTSATSTRRILDAPATQLRGLARLPAAHYPQRLALRRSTARTRRVLRRSAELHELVTADDPAAVLDWRISPTHLARFRLPGSTSRSRVGCVISSRRCMRRRRSSSAAATPVGRGDSGRP